MALEVNSGQEWNWKWNRELCGFGWGLMRLSFGEGFIDFGSLLKSMVLLKDVIVVK